ncbi:hypothetical protein SAMN05444672_15112 [Bacillus sp. OK838]|nr:hypothetical protein SAMN05444672_15112 [Bacillus sp. OK838]
MSKNIYSEFQIKKLEKNPNIISTSERQFPIVRNLKQKLLRNIKRGNSPLKFS